jgi:hypothetical protein
MVEYQTIWCNFSISRALQFEQEGRNCIESTRDCANSDDALDPDTFVTAAYSLKYRTILHLHLRLKVPTPPAPPAGRRLTNSFSFIPGREPSAFPAPT